MTAVNMFPWRTKKQAHEKKQFLILCVFAACLALACNGV